MPPHWSELWHDVVGGRDDYLTGNMSCKKSHNVVEALATGPGAQPGLPTRQHSQYPTVALLWKQPNCYSFDLGLGRISKPGITLPRSCSSQVATIDGFCNEKLIRTKCPFCSSKDDLQIWAQRVCACVRACVLMRMPTRTYLPDLITWIFTVGGVEETDIPSPGPDLSR